MPSASSLSDQSMHGCHFYSLKSIQKHWNSTAHCHYL